MPGVHQSILSHRARRVNVPNASRCFRPIYIRYSSSSFPPHFYVTSSPRRFRARPLSRADSGTIWKREFRFPKESVDLNDRPKRASHPTPRWSSSEPQVLRLPNTTWWPSVTRSPTSSRSRTNRLGRRPSSSANAWPVSARSSSVFRARSRPRDPRVRSRDISRDKMRCEARTSTRCWCTASTTPR